MFERAIDCADGTSIGEISTQPSWESVGTYTVDLSLGLSSRRAVCCCQLSDKEKRLSLPILVSTRTVSVFRLVRLTLGWHAKEAKAQRRQQNGGRVDEGGKHEPLLGEQRDAVVTGEGGRRGTARRR